MKRPRVFYGWYVVGVAFLSTMATMGISGGPVFGFFIKPMSAEFGWTRTEMVFAMTLGGLAGGAIGPLVGRVVDRYGARMLMVIGGIITGALVMVVGQVNTLIQFYIVFALGMVIARASVSFLVPQTAVVNWFIKKRGRAVAITAVGVPTGNIFLATLITRVMGIYDWRVAWVAMGVAIWTLAVIPAGIFMRRRPEDMGLSPDGVEDSSNSASPDDVEELAQGRGLSRLEVSWGTREALRTRAFWLLLTGTSITGLGSGGFLIHMAPYFTDIGLSDEAAAAAVVASAVGSAIGKISFGLMVERIHVRYMYTIQAFATGITLMGLIAVTGTQTILVASLIWGVAMGGSATLMGVVWPDYFGRESAGTIRGYSMVFQSIVMALSPLFSAYVYDVFGAYSPAFTILVGSHFVGGTLLFLAKPPQKKTELVSTLT